MTTGTALDETDPDVESTHELRRRWLNTSPNYPAEVVIVAALSVAAERFLHSDLPARTPERFAGLAVDCILAITDGRLEPAGEKR